VQYVYSYTVEDKISDTVKIRVSDADASRSNLVNDVSTETFRIKGKLRITYPNTGSETWSVGDKPTILWQRSGTINTVIIDYSIDSGNNWNNITSTADGLLNSYEWTIPDAARSLPSQALIRISDASDTTGTVKDTSDNPFTIRGVLSVTAPASGEYVEVLNNYPIKWTRQGNIPELTIKFSVGSGDYEICQDDSEPPNDAVDVDASLGSTTGWSWYVPDRLSTSRDVKIQIIDEQDPQVTATVQFKLRGEVNFQGNTIPTEGERWEVGSNHTIQWTTVGSIQTVNLFYSTDDGQNYTLIGSSTTGQLTWQIPTDVQGIVTTTAKLKAIDALDTGTYDESPTFKIVPKFSNVRVTDESGSTVQEIIANSTDTTPQKFYIKWTAEGQAPYVRLRYSAGGFDVYSVVIQDTEGTGDGQEKIKNDMSFLWHVPDIAQPDVYNWNDAYVRVEYYDDQFVYADSASFKIVPGFTVVSPNTSLDSDDVVVSKDYTISWTCTSAYVDYVEIFYSTDGGATYPAGNKITNPNPINGQPTTYFSNTGNAGDLRSFVWSVPETLPITTQFKIKVVDVDPDTTTAYDESDDVVQVRPWFHIIQPDGGELFEVYQDDTSTDIEWEWKGGVSQVKLEICDDNNCDLIDVTTNDGSYSNAIEGWKIPDFISDTVKIRISDADQGHPYPATEDTSDDYFKIKAVLRVESPNSSSDKWVIGTTREIKWYTTGSNYTDGSTPAVKIIAYTTDPADLWFRDDQGAVYTIDNPLVIETAYLNNGNNYTTRSWSVPDKASKKVKIRVIDINDADGIVYDDSDEEFSIQGSFTITSPTGSDRWVVGSTHEITWDSVGSSIVQAELTYSVDGGTNWKPVEENEEGTANDGIVTNDGSFIWTVPDEVASTGTTVQTLIKIEDPSDSDVNNISDTFDIIGSFTINTPIGSERWVTNESHTVSWSTNGSISKVNLYYFKIDTSANLIPISTNYTNFSGDNSKEWKIPDHSDLPDGPITVKIRIEDAQDPTVYAESPQFTMDYYTITWDVRDFLTNMPIGGGLVVSDTSGWEASGLSSETPIGHRTPYGGWSASWEHEDYGAKTKDYVADSDQEFTIYLESKVVHVWEAQTEYVYDPNSDKLTFNTTLIRDGSIVYGAQNCTIKIFDYDGNGNVMELSDPDADEAGFFHTEWANTGLDTSRVYNALTTVENVLGGIFKTPFLINLTPTVSMHNVVNEVEEQTNLMVGDKTKAEVLAEGGFVGIVTTKLDEQATKIDTKMEEQKELIVGDKSVEEVKAAGGMIGMVEETLQSFEDRSTTVINTLQSGAQQAVEAGEELESIAKKYSWNAVVSPNPALTGEMITLQLQGQPELFPILNIYSWDNQSIIKDWVLAEVSPGLYQFEFQADSRFQVGKAYTYVITEQTTGGLVTGSGMVEEMSITTIAGLAAAAPEAERTAKKTLDLVKALEATIGSEDGISIALTLQNLQESVEELPEIMAREGPSAIITSALNEISDKLNEIVSEEGYDLEELFEEKLSESPTIKEIRKRTTTIEGVLNILRALFEAKFGGMDTPIVSAILQ
jgi:hypothetical protein